MSAICRLSPMSKSNISVPNTFNSSRRFITNQVYIAGPRKITRFDRHNFDSSLHVIVNVTGLTLSEILNKCRSAVKGGANCLQVWGHFGDTIKILQTAMVLEEEFKGTEVPVVINNHVDVAAVAKTWAAHTGQRDTPVKTARLLLGHDAIIGYTVENLDDVRKAESLDVDYLGLQLFSSLNTKPGHRELFGLKGLEEARSISSHRFVVLGGINDQNLKDVCSRLRLGKRGDGIAMCGELWRGKNPEVVAQRTQAVMKKYVAQSET